MYKFVRWSDKKGRMADEMEEMFETSLNKLRRRTERWSRIGRGIRGGREGCRRNTRILRWGKAMNQDSTNKEKTDIIRIVLSCIVYM